MNRGVMFVLEVLIVATIVAFSLEFKPFTLGDFCPVFEMILASKP